MVVDLKQNLAHECSKLRWKGHIFAHKEEPHFNCQVRTTLMFVVILVTLNSNYLFRKDILSFCNSKMQFVF